jgi:hypothetical protein
MRKDSGQAVLNSTMAELAFMLVFVFAIFAAVGNAHEPDTPNAAARVLAEEKENVSCLYVPWDPQGEGRAQSGKFIDEGQYTRYSLNTAENNNTEKRPAIRSLLQFYWLRMEDTRFATVETVYLHFNLDQLSDSSKNEKPFLYLNSDARAALFYMELRLNDFLYDYLNASHNNYVRKPAIPHLKKGPILRFQAFRDTYAFTRFLMRMDQEIFEIYKCRFFYDFFNFPVEGFENTPYESETFSQGEIDLATRHRESFNDLIAPRIDILTGVRRRPSLGNTIQMYPGFRDSSG